MIWYIEQNTSQISIDSYGTDNDQIAFELGTDSRGGITKVHLKDGGASGTVKFKYKTTGTATTTLPIVINFPQPILFTSNLCVAFVTEHVTVCSIFHSGGNNT